MNNRIILHIDFNSFFASVEQQANPFLRGKPIAVTGKGRHSLDLAAAERGTKRVDIAHLDTARSVITTASREAKQYGVKTTMATWEAKRLCPALHLIPGDPRKYAHVTEQFLRILRTYCDTVECFSTDEAFADCTQSGGDYLGAALLAQRIRAVIREQIGEACTVSLGIAPNKLVAKLASESVKPNGFTVVRPEDVDRFVASRPLAEFCGIGRKIERRLAVLGATSVATLRTFPRHVLRSEFKSYGDFLYDAARGVGDDRVQGEEREPKSVGHSYTFPFDLVSADDGYRHLLLLAERVAWRLRKQRLAATHIALYARFGRGDGVFLQTTVNDYVADGRDLLAPLWPTFAKQLPWEDGIRYLGISTSGLFPLGVHQHLFSPDTRREAVLAATDVLHARYGFGVVRPAATLGTTLKERVSGWHYDHEEE